jgi:hypothetical protein
MPQRASAFYFFLQLRLVFIEINDKAVVITFTNLFDVVKHLDLEAQPAAVYAHEVNFGAYAFAHRGRPQVADGDNHADLAS